MVAGQGRATQCDLGVGAAGRVEGAGEQVAQVHDQIGRLRAQVGQHGFKGEQVAMGVGEDGDAHQTALTARSVMASTCALAQSTSGNVSSPSRRTRDSSVPAMTIA